MIIFNRVRFITYYKRLCYIKALMENKEKCY